MALYTPDGESATNVRCTGACVSIWKPLRPGDARLSNTSTITRPDGTKQLTLSGKPLITPFEMPKTRLCFLLYAQVVQSDGAINRNILLTHCYAA